MSIVARGYQKTLLAPPAGFGIVRTMIHRRYIAAALTVGLLTIGVRAAQEPSTNLNVVASFYPIYIATLNVVGQTPGVTVTSMAQPTVGCLHDYQLSTDDMVTLSSADIFVINGAGMEAFLDKAVRQAPRMKTIDASRGIDLLRDGAAVNPHVWVSVSRHMQQVANIAAGLAAADPGRAEHYLQNAAAYTKRLEALRVRMQVGLKDLKSRDIVTFHEAFPYFADEFRLRIVATIAREPGSEPSGRELARTVQAVRKAGVKALFAEPQYSPRVATTIARETGATVYVLDPAVTGPASPHSYVDIMEKNLVELQRALK